MTAIQENAMRIVKEGSVKARVRRAGMLQVQTFRIKRVKLGSKQFVELSLEKVLDMSELIRLANEFGLPVEAENGRAFPTGKGATDFVGL